MKTGKKVKITLRGVITTYTRKLYPGDIYSTESHQEKLTCGLLKQLLVDYISRRWQKLSSNTFGTGGFASLAQYYLIQVLIAVCLLVALALMWLIVYKI
jgi:hypothetical protein